MNWQFPHVVEQYVRSMTIPQREAAGAVAELADELSHQLALGAAEADLARVQHICACVAWLSPAEREPLREDVLAGALAVIAGAAELGRYATLAPLEALWWKWPLLAEDEQLATAVAEGMRSCTGRLEDLLAADAPAPRAIDAEESRLAALVRLVARWRPAQRRALAHAVLADTLLPRVDSLGENVQLALLEVVAAADNDAEQALLQSELLPALPALMACPHAATRAAAIRVLGVSLREEHRALLFGPEPLTALAAMQEVALDSARPLRERLGCAAALLDALPHVLPEADAAGALPEDWLPSVTETVAQDASDSGPYGAAGEARRALCYALRRCGGRLGAGARAPLEGAVAALLSAHSKDEDLALDAADALATVHGSASSSLGEDTLRACREAMLSGGAGGWVSVSRALARSFSAQLRDEEAAALLTDAAGSSCFQRDLREPAPDARARSTALEALLARAPPALAAFARAQRSAMTAVAAVAAKKLPGSVPLARRLVLRAQAASSGGDASEDVPWAGVSLPCMRALTFHPSYYSGMTTGDLLAAAVKPPTAPAGHRSSRSFAEMALLRDAEPGRSALPWQFPRSSEGTFDLQLPTVSRPLARAYASEFISHGWAYCFEMVLRALAFGGNARRHAYYWFDELSVDQHAAPERPASWWDSVFRNAVGSFATVSLVLDDWHVPLPPTRIWCVWEMFSALDGAADVWLCFPPELSMTIWPLVKGDPARVLATLRSIDIRDAEASVQSDIARILEAVDAAPGLSADLVSARVAAFFASYLLPFAAYAGDARLCEDMLDMGATPDAFTSITRETFATIPNYAVCLAFEEGHDEVLGLLLRRASPRGHVLRHLVARGATLSGSSKPELVARAQALFPRLAQDGALDKAALRREVGEALERAADDSAAARLLRECLSALDARPVRAKSVNNKTKQETKKEKTKKKKPGNCVVM